MAPRKRGSRLTEVFITMALAAIFIVVAVPSVGKFNDQQHAEKIIDLAEQLSEASLQFRKDVGRGAIEFTSSQDGQSYSHPKFHELSMPQSIQGWRGPYLSTPLARDHNPFGTAIYVQNSLSASPAHGFSLHGLTGTESQGDGQFVVFHGIPKRVAEHVDNILDKKTKSNRNWHRVGRVEWAPGGGGSLSICLLDNPKK